MGEGKTVGVGDNLQEDVHVVKNGSESRVLAIVLCDLRAEGGQRGRVVDACTRLPSAAAASRWEVEGRSSVGLAPQRPPPGGLTFFANQTPLAWVTHSREWMPVSIQMAGRLLPPVLNWKRRAWK